MCVRQNYSSTYSNTPTTTTMTKNSWCIKKHGWLHTRKRIQLCQTNTGAAIATPSTFWIERAKIQQLYSFSWSVWEIRWRISISFSAMRCVCYWTHNRETLVMETANSIRTAQCLLNRKCILCVSEWKRVVRCCFFLLAVEKCWKWFSL